MKVGDVVDFKRGSTKTLMVVNKLYEKARDKHGVENWIECQWWDGERFLTARFCPKELTPVVDANAAQSPEPIASPTSPTS